ncbi:hypothetical protein [Streptomyces sp. NPDC001315]|uniref:hypothetical protein n=1 Tax=Streptomyces sp. NPDC001315 TaxID=3364562 RepID=UPI003688E8DA
MQCTCQRKADELHRGLDAELTGTDPLLCLDSDWNRSYRRMLGYLAAGGTVTGPVNRTGLGHDPSFRPGAWLRKQAKARTEGKLTEQQNALLNALHAAAG